MVQLVLVILAAVGAYGLFLTLRGLHRLRMIGQKRLFYSVLAVLLAAPLVITLAVLFLPPDKYNFWTVPPLLIAALLWIIQGYALELHLHRERRLRLVVRRESRDESEPPPHFRRRSLMQIIGGMLLWLGGVLEIYPIPLVETCGLFLWFYLCGSGVWCLWKYRRK